MQAEADKPAFLADLLAALGEPTRLRIMNLLHVQPLCVCELQGALGLSEPLVSRHLARLRFAHLVTATRDGNRMMYRLTRADSPARIILERFLTDIRLKEPCLQRDLDSFHELPGPRRKAGKGGEPMKIEILGPGCMRCFATEQNVREALGQLGLAAEVIHVSDRDAFQKRGIKFTPAVVVDGRTKSSGRIPEVSEILRWLKQAVADTAKEPSVRR